MNDPAGTWRGESSCVVKPSACRDEDSLYRVSRKGNAPDRVNLSANKIVDGKEVNMGSTECAYNAKLHSIDCPLPKGLSLHLQVSGDATEGKLTLGNGTLWRKISLRRNEQQ